MEIEQEETKEAPAGGKPFLFTVDHLTDEENWKSITKFLEQIYKE